MIVGPFEQGNDYEILFWVAEELEEKGIVNFHDGLLFGPSELYRAQWKERVQVAGQISELPEEFYPRLRRYLSRLGKEINTNPEKVQELNKANQLSRDIVNSRLKKIIALSTGPSQSDVVTRKLTTEEQLVYERIGRFVKDWRKNILK